MTKPLISVVTGSVDRLDFLKQMVYSVRENMPDGINYELVVVDGGSVDGTIQWCREQPDIVLIEHGGLRGALRAFTDGGNAATGKYTILANDDIRFHPGSILAAVRHLETYPDCGAVAFADNRPAPGYGDGYKVQTMSVRTVDGLTVNAVYAQVGMFRTWLGKLVGWWGADDPVMGQGRTYGGDNWLSARILQHGYRIEGVDGCKIDDLVPMDNLRQLNHNAEAQNPGVYYKAYPQPPQMLEEPDITNPDRPQLRVLLATLYEPNFGKYKSGLREAFARVGLVADVDYVAPGGANLLLRVAEAWQPHLIFCQMVNADLMGWLRKACPTAVIVVWHGDVYMDVLLSPEMLKQAKYTDLTLCVNASALPEFEKRGIPAAYWQIGFEPVESLPTERSHDILFMANAYSEQRLALGNFLRSLPYNVGIYGQGWRPQADGNTLYDFARGGALYERCKIAIGDSQYTDDKAFVSNRFVEALAHGAFLLHQYVPELEEWTGFIDGVHYASWIDMDDLREQIAYYMANDAEREQIAAAGREYVRANYSFDAQVEKLLELIKNAASVQAEAV